MKVPLGSNRSKSFDRAQNSSKDADRASDSQSLPALNEPFRAGGSKAQQGSRGIPGWRPPPQREIRDGPKPSTQHQIDIANKLSKGLSSRASGEEQPTKGGRGGKMIVSARHRVYSNTSTSSGSAAGAIYYHNPQYVYASDPMSGDGAVRSGIAFDSYMDTEGGGEAGVYSAMMSSLHQSSISNGGPPISRYVVILCYYLRIVIRSACRQGSVNKISSSAAPLRQQTFAFENGVSPNIAFGESSASLSGKGHSRR